VLVKQLHALSGHKQQSLATEADDDHYLSGRCLGIELFCWVTLDVSAVCWVSFTLVRCADGLQALSPATWWTDVY